MKDAKSLLRTIGSSQHAQEEREDNDFYATDPKAIDLLFSVENFSDDIWEPACGEGHLSKRMAELGKNVYSTDLINRGYGDEFFDYLSPLFNPKETWDGDIITNPPYSLAQEFVLKSLSLVKQWAKVAMFLRILFLESERRFVGLFKDNPPARIHVFSKRISCAKNANFDAYGSTITCYAWFVFEKGFKGKTQLDWINTGEGNE